MLEHVDFRPRRVDRMILQALCVLALAVSTCGASPGGDDVPTAADRLREVVETDVPLLEVAGVRLAQSSVVRSVYRSRLYQPLWVEDTLSRRGTELAALLSSAADIGLEPADYHTAELAELIPWSAQLDATRRQALLAEVDVLLTDALMRYASDRARGRVPPELIDPDWQGRRASFDLGVFLRSVEARDIGGVLAELDPAAPEFARLIEALAHYRDRGTQDRWRMLRGGDTIVRPGERSPEVLSLRERLRAEPALDVEASGSHPDVLDRRLEAALREFQRRYGLDRDGVLGPETRRVANRSPSERASQIALALERQRWRRSPPARKLIRVNIAAAELELIDESRTRLVLSVLVGLPYRRTPEFSAVMTHIVLNPTWTVPDRIAVEDLLPHIVADRSYLEREGFEVFAGADPARAIDPDEIDWTSLSRDPAAFPFLLRQRPGPTNSLGAIKFMFPNDFDVYLHDTTNRESFRAPRRAISAGCVRLEHPFELANALFANEARWPAALAEARSTPDREIVVRLADPVPVQLVYATAWVESGGAVHFREDVYERDARLREALAERARSRH